MLDYREEEVKELKQMAIFGAKSIALGVYQAVKALYPEYPVCCFLVSSLQDNPSVLAGLPVRQLEEFSKGLPQDKKCMVHVLVGTPEDVHLQITAALKQHGFYHYTCMDSRKEAKLMEQYFIRKRIFPSIHTLKSGTEAAHLQIFMARFYKDRHLQNEHEIPDWLHPLQAGAGLTRHRVAEYTDNTGDNISCKNVNYCELTALYWIWKNKLMLSLPGDYENESDNEYFGLFHYRRILDISDRDLFRIKFNSVDVVLPFPTLHEPDIREHHARYIRESDWAAMIQALEELQPSYVASYEEVFSQQYFYNYNMLIARKNILRDYCAWLFPILKRTEELSMPKGWERADRYIGYLGESLMTLYFLYHKDDLNIVHTGRLMLT